MVTLWSYCYMLRVLLAAKLVVVLLAGVAFAWWEEIPIGQGVYFSLITATSVGYGDIAPETGFGQCLSLVMAFAGTLFFGLLVAIANQALRHSIEEYKRIHGKLPTSTQS